MKKVLIIANMLFASATVWGMNASLVSQKNNRNIFVETKDLSEREWNIRAQMMEQIHEIENNRDFKKIDNSFNEINKMIEETLIDPNVLELLLSYKNEKPLADQQIKNLMVNSRILNSVDQDGNTLLSYIIKSFSGMAIIGGGDGWNPSWNRTKLILLGTLMLRYGADPTLNTSGELLIKQIKDYLSEVELNKRESSALMGLLSAYKDVTKESEYLHKCIERLNRYLKQEKIKRRKYFPKYIKALNRHLKWWRIKRRSKKQL